jgi:tRNA dimethylallyltransferase
MTETRTPYDLLVILGPTASGKTALAARLADRMNGEVISADSRQVYRRMDIGTGKDRADYLINGREIRVHLLDIADPGYQYNVFEYQHDFYEVYHDIHSRGRFPVLCGGSGLYIEAVLRNYQLIRVPVNEELRAELKDKTLGELTDILKSFKTSLHNITDIVNTKRAIRAIEIEEYYATHGDNQPLLPAIKSLVVGIHTEVSDRRARITERLHKRLSEGLVAEVRNLLESGVSKEELIYYGLEYKFVTLYLTGELSYEEMTGKLNTSIHQFAKRQMTWFRRMGKQGITIHWIDGALPTEDKTEMVLKLLNSEGTTSKRKEKQV